MKIHEVIGNVTLSRCHPDYVGCRLLATEPLDGALLGQSRAAEPELVVVWDD